MLRFFSRKPVLGLEISSSALRLVALSTRAGKTVLLSAHTTDLPAGVVSAAYSSLNILRPDEFASIVRDGLSSLLPVRSRRTALSLPDGIFRVQTLEFDQLPGRPTERERLIRWRLEKAAFDVSESCLRYQILGRPNAGYTVLACFAKQAVIAQYASLLSDAGLEPWSIGLSSFHTLNFYAPQLQKKSDRYALAQVSDDAFTTIITENGGVRFYRHKELKRGSGPEVSARIIKELEDSFHFYTHRDRTKETEVEQLYLTGTSQVIPSLAGELAAMPSFNVEVLSPTTIYPEAGNAGPEMASALGARGEA